MVRVSVVVPTFKRPDLLARCLEALLAQDFVPADYEVIIVDDAACDQTQCQVEQLAKKAKMCGYTLRYIPVTDSHGPAAARNIGLYAAQSAIIAYTDDDCIPTPGWLKAGVKGFDRRYRGCRRMHSRAIITCHYRLRIQRISSRTLRVCNG